MEEGAVASRRAVVPAQPRPLAEAAPAPHQVILLGWVELRRRARAHRHLRPRPRVCLQYFKGDLALVLKPDRAQTKSATRQAWSQVDRGVSPPPLCFSATAPCQKTTTIKHASQHNDVFESFLTRGALFVPVFPITSLLNQCLLCVEGSILMISTEGTIGIGRPSREQCWW